MTAGGALGSSVTLDEVFAVLGAKRVPLAPELAGYLVLEIAEHADPNGGNVDPRSVFVGEEGTVALVKRARSPGDAEASVRAMLARLLDASGSQTPALAAASKRASGPGLPALAEELEAALIPVNRAAGRRALARLAREVKRVMLGVGRNALPSSSEVPAASRRGSALPPPPGEPPPSQSSPSSQTSSASPAARAPSASFSRDDEQPTVARGHIPEELLRKSSPNTGPSAASSDSQGPGSSASGWHELPTMEIESLERAPSPSQADVDALIEGFGISGGGTNEKQHARDLRTMLGFGATPGPPPVGAQAPGPTGPDARDGARAHPIVVPPVSAPPRRDDPPRVHADAAPIDADADDPPTLPAGDGIEALLALGAEPRASVTPAPASPSTMAYAGAPAQASSIPPTAPSPRAPPPDPPGPRSIPARDPEPRRIGRAGGARPSASSSSSVAVEDDRRLPTQRARFRQPAPSLAASVDRGRQRRGPGLVIALALLAIGLGAFAVWLLRSAIPTAPAAPHLSAAAAPAPRPPPPCRGSLVVSGVPAHAEVLLRKGQAPVDVDRMPVGARLEFVATAEGYAPKRVVVPAGATWDKGPDGKPRFEAGVQLDKSKAKAGTTDPWPAADPGSAVGGEGPPGAVHVVATPRGAEIWMVAGVGPDARIEQIACDEGTDVLVAGPTTYRKRLHVAAGDFLPDDTAGGPPSKTPPKVARISAQ